MEQLILLVVVFLLKKGAPPIKFKIILVTCNNSNEFSIINFVPFFDFIKK